MKIQCPVCSSYDTESKFIERQWNYTVLNKPLISHPVTIRIMENECKSCGEKGDFEGKNDDIIYNEIWIIISIKIRNFVKILDHKNINIPFFERKYRIPPGTLRKWQYFKAIDIMKGYDAFVLCQFLMNYEEICNLTNL